MCRRLLLNRGDIIPFYPVQYLLFNHLRSILEKGTAIAQTQDSTLTTD